MVFLGHQKVLRSAHSKAKKNNLKFSVITFEPVPVMFWQKKTNHRINNLDQKISGLKIKVDFVYIIKFNKKILKFKTTFFYKKDTYK